MQNAYARAIGLICQKYTIVILFLHCATAKAASSSTYCSVESLLTEALEEAYFMVLLTRQLPTYTPSTGSQRFKAEMYEPTPIQPYIVDSTILMFPLDPSRSGSVHHGASRRFHRRVVHLRLVQSRDARANAGRRRDPPKPPAFVGSFSECCQLSLEGPAGRPERSWKDVLGLGPRPEGLRQGRVVWIVPHRSKLVEHWRRFCRGTAALASVRKALVVSVALGILF